MNKLSNKALSKASFGTTPEYFTRMVAEAVQPRPARRRWPVLLVAALLAVALAGTAVAVNVGRQAARAAAIRAARQAVIDQYGLTQETLGLFMEATEPTADGWVVRIAPQGMNEAAIGEYTVTIAANGQAKASWTHDGVDPTGYADGSLNAPVWGQPQLLNGLALTRAHNEALNSIDWKNYGDMSLAERAALDQVLVDATAQGATPFVVHVAPGPDDIQEADAVALAKAEIIKKYGVAPDALEERDEFVEFLKYAEDPERVYRINLQQPEGTPPESGRGTFYVEIYSPSGTIAKCSWYVNPARQTLPEGPLTGYEDAVREFIEDGALAVRSATEKAAIAARIAEAGYEKYLDGKRYAVPGARDLPEAEAIAQANAALKESFGLTDETLALFAPTAAFLESDGTTGWVVDYALPEDLDFTVPEDQVRLQFRFEFGERIGAYQVRLSAAGAKPQATWSLAAQRGPTAYTAQTWGQAPAFDGPMLTDLLKLWNASQALIAHYDPLVDLSVQWTKSEAAAYDQMFREAGFTPQRYYHGLPAAGDLTYEQALKIARETLMQEYGLTAEWLDGSYFRYEFAVYEQPNWWFNYQRSDDDYGISIDARTGEVLGIGYITGGNG